MPKKDYAPKFCRTRNCSLPFGHEGDHDGAITPVPIVTPVFNNRRLRRAAGQIQMAAEQKDGFHYRPRKSPKGQPVTGARAHMEDIRGRRERQIRQNRLRRQLAELENPSPAVVFVDEKPKRGRKAKAK